MSTITKFFSILFAALTLLIFQPARAQEKLAWLDDYTGEMLIGSDTYQYNFTSVEGKDCKMKIEELITNKKGSTETHAWIFYLSDIDPSKISFKAKGKSLNISLETFQSQRFITYYEDGEIDGYTNAIGISMNEVEMTRSFLETFKEHITNCKATQVAWKNRDQAFAWLVNNIGAAVDEDVQWDQKFKQGSRSYLVDFEAGSVNGKGEQESSAYVLDLTDIDTAKMNLRISGKSLMLELPVKEGKRYIRVETQAGTAFTDELLIHAADIELARQMFNAFKYVLTSTTAERPKWDSYSAALGFVKDNLGEAGIGKYLYSNSITFDNSPFGPVDLMINTSESDGSSAQVHYIFYLADMMDQLRFEVSKSGITLQMGTKEKRAYIREMQDGKVSAYSTTLDIHVSGIDMARDIINAFEYAIGNSEEKIEEFKSISEIGTWFSANVGDIEMDGDTYKQNLKIDQEMENQLIIEKELLESDGTATNTKFLLFPEDIDLEKQDIKVSGKKLYVPLGTGSNKFIQNFEGDQLQAFTAGVDIQFSDPLLAKNFMAAIRFLKENTVPYEKTVMSPEEARAFLLADIQAIELPGKQYEQVFETNDEDHCKMGFTQLEIDDKKASTNYFFEFFASDIDPGNSKITVKGELISVILVTKGNEKLIKPFKNGEAGDFVDDFTVYTQDVLLARKTLAAFAALSKGCK